jgi:hypothetical protein
MRFGKLLENVVFQYPVVHNDCWTSSFSNTDCASTDSKKLLAHRLTACHMGNVTINESSKFEVYTQLFVHADQSCRAVQHEMWQTRTLDLIIGLDLASRESYESQIETLRLLKKARITIQTLDDRVSNLNRGADVLFRGWKRLTGWWNLVVGLNVAFLVTSTSYTRRARPYLFVLLVMQRVMETFICVIYLDVFRIICTVLGLLVVIINTLNKI